MLVFRNLLSFSSHKLYIKHGDVYDNDADDVTAPRVQFATA